MGGDAEEAAPELCKRGAGAVVVTLGAMARLSSPLMKRFAWQRLWSSPSTRWEPATYSAGF